MDKFQAHKAVYGWVEMIGIFLGKQNTGKTLSMTYYLETYFNNGYEIFTNYNVHFPHKKITKELIQEYVKSKQQFTNAVFGIDEIYILFDARNSASSRNKIFSYFLLQTSKRNVHLFGTAQYFETIERRFRKHCIFKCYCERYIKNSSGKFEILDKINRYLDGDIISNLYIRNQFIINQGENNIKISEYFIKASRMFDKYDTTQLLDL
jgi:hypothetical protein